MKPGTMAILIILGIVSLTTPAAGLERFDIVTTQELKTMLAEREAGNLDFLLVNTLDALIFEHHAIPGSVNVPWSRAADMADRLGPDLERLIVTY